MSHHQQRQGRGEVGAVALDLAEGVAVIFPEVVADSEVAEAVDLPAPSSSMLTKGLFQRLIRHRPRLIHSFRRSSRLGLELNVR